MIVFLGFESFTIIYSRPNKISTIVATCYQKMNNSMISKPCFVLLYAQYNVLRVFICLRASKFE